MSTITTTARAAIAAAALLVPAAAGVVGAAPAFAAVSGTVDVAPGATLSVRTAPSATATKVGSLADNATVSIICKVTGSSVTGSQGTTTQWDKISTGYISHAYVRTSVAVPACTTAAATGTVDVAAGATLSVRSTPSTTASKVGSLADGARVTLTCVTTGTTVTGSQGTSSQWYRISTGYVARAYVAPSGTPPTCSTTPPPTTPPPSSSGIAAGIAWGKTQVGTLYVGCSAGDYRLGKVPATTLRHGPTTWCPDQTKTYLQPAGKVGYDCSGLMVMVFRTAGISMPHGSSSAIRSYVPQVTKSLSSMRPGDMLARSGHVVMYIGNHNGVPSVLESTPYAQQADGSWKGTRIHPASGFVADSRYTVHRTPGV